MGLGRTSPLDHTKRGCIAFASGGVDANLLHTGRCGWRAIKKAMIMVLRFTLLPGDQFAAFRI